MNLTIQLELHICSSEETAENFWVPVATEELVVQRSFKKMVFFLEPTISYFSYYDVNQLIKHEADIYFVIAFTSRALVSKRFSWFHMDYAQCILCGWDKSRMLQVKFSVRSDPPPAHFLCECWTHCKCRYWLFVFEWSYR